MAQIEKMMDEIKGMTVLELNELVKALEDEFGVSAAAAAPVMMAGAVPGAAAGGGGAAGSSRCSSSANSGCSAGLRAVR